MSSGATYSKTRKAGNRDHAHKSAATARVLVAGTGNIGSHLLEPLLHAGFRRLWLVDRDVVEPPNLCNQAFQSAAELGRAKAEVLAERGRAALKAAPSDAYCPPAEVEAIVGDLEDVPLGVFDGVDVALGGLDSLRARQILVSERAYPQGVPVVDGAVDDDGWQARVLVLVPGAACLECSWGPAHYRQMARETPCRPGVGAAGPPTRAPAALGAAVAVAMVREAVSLLSERPTESYEIAFDVAAGRQLTSRLKPAAACRFDHRVIDRRGRLATPFAAATVADLLMATHTLFGEGEPVRLEFRRRLFDVGLFGGDRWLRSDQLQPYTGRRLAELGLTPRDRIRVESGSRTALVDLATAAEAHS